MFWILIVVAVLYLLQRRTVETFYEPEFVLKEYMQMVVMNSDYFDRMNYSDLIARDIEVTNNIQIDKNTYRSEYIRHLLPFTTTEKIFIAEMIDEIHKLLPRKSVLKNIKWKFAKQSSNIENGYPHTLADVIVLPESFLASGIPQDSFISTMIHEKIHVFQRLYPVETLKYVEAIGFKPLSEKYLSDSLLSIKRNNPDIKGLFYRNDILPLQIYNTAKPATLADSKTIYINISDNTMEDTYDEVAQIALPSYITQKEHPHEIMAVMIPLIIMKNLYPDEIFATSKAWCEKYLIL